MVMFLMVIAVLCGLGGLVFASQATLGLALIGFGCLLLLLARMEQAYRYHHELRTGKDFSAAVSDAVAAQAATTLPPRPIDRDTTFPSVG